MAKNEEGLCGCKIRGETRYSLTEKCANLNFFLLGISWKPQPENTLDNHSNHRTIPVNLSNDSQDPTDLGFVR